MSKLTPVRRPVRNPDQIVFRVYRAVSATQLEVKLWPADIAGPAHPGDDLSAPNDIAALHENDRTVGIRRHPAARVFNQDEITKSL